MSAVNVSLGPLLVRTLSADYALDPADNFCILNFTNKSNLTIAAGACPVGFIVFITCPTSSVECGGVFPAAGGRLNEQIRTFGETGFGPGVNILVSGDFYFLAIGFTPGSGRV